MKMIPKYISALPSEKTYIFLLYNRYLRFPPSLPPPTIKYHTTRQWHCCYQVDISAQSVLDKYRRVRHILSERGQYWDSISQLPSFMFTAMSAREMIPYYFSITVRVHAELYTHYIFFLIPSTHSITLNSTWKITRTNNPRMYNSKVKLRGKFH